MLCTRLRKSSTLWQKKKGYEQSKFLFEGGIIILGQNIVQKIILPHLVSGEMKQGTEIAISIDQTLTQDSTGTMAYLQFEALGIPRVKTKKSLAYIDHNTLQTGPENADDHAYIQSIANKYGIFFSRPGNGICHQVHLERFGIPGMTLLGSDSHTPTGGALGMLAIGAGGLNVAAAMGGSPYHITMPKVYKINLNGILKPMVSAKDVILEVLRILSVKGGVGTVLEYSECSLTVPERATITNMGAELGATTSIFPSDEITKQFLKAQGREKDWIELKSDTDAEYYKIIDIDLSNLEPLAAVPHSPDNVRRVKDLEGLKINQVAIGSCTNSSFADLMKVAAILKGNKVHPDISLVISPGSRQVLTMLSQNGALSDIISAGARILECSCGPCIGMGQSPASNGVSLRTFNRNFEGRSGTSSAQVYLVSPETAAVSALNGVITNPASMRQKDGSLSHSLIPDNFLINDNMIITPSDNPENVEIIRGPNIKPFPLGKKLEDILEGKALIKLGNNITTDHIMPSNAKLLPYRSNIPYLSDYCLTPCDKDFPARAKNEKGGFIIAGSNYGQGSSREHAALVPLYLGIRGVIAKSFARIHKSNLINNGILPLIFKNESDYEKLFESDLLEINDVQKSIRTGNFKIYNTSQGVEFDLSLDVSEREKNILLAGGLLNYIRNNLVNSVNSISN